MIFCSILKLWKIVNQDVLLMVGLFHTDRLSTSILSLYTNSLVNADSFYANFTNTTFEKKTLFLAMREKSPNSFTNTSQLLG